MTFQNKRTATLAELLIRYPHAEASTLPPPGEPLARYAVVSRLESETRGYTYWIDLCEDAVSFLRNAHADYYESGFQPFIVVDLDTQVVYDVEIAFSLGYVAQSSKLSFEPS
jgi:hypothetical protein